MLHESSINSPFLAGLWAGNRLVNTLCLLWLDVANGIIHVNGAPRKCFGAWGLSRFREFHALVGIRPFALFTFLYLSIQEHLPAWLGQQSKEEEAFA